MIKQPPFQKLPNPVYYDGLRNINEGVRYFVSAKEAFDAYPNCAEVIVNSFLDDHDLFLPVESMGGGSFIHSDKCSRGEPVLVYTVGKGFWEKSELNCYECREQKTIESLSGAPISLFEAGLYE